MILYCNHLPQNNDTTNTIASIVSIVLGLLSIVLSIWFYVLSSKLSRDTTKAIDEIKVATKQLQDIHSKYVDVIFNMFKNDHQKMADKQFGETETGGTKQSNIENKE